VQRQKERREGEVRAVADVLSIAAVTLILGSLFMVLLIYIADHIGVNPPDTFYTSVYVGMSFAILFRVILSYIPYARAKRK
jgi:hypothetical protein